MNSLIEKAKSIFLKTLVAINIERQVNERIRLEGENLLIEGEAIRLTDYDEIVLVGFGKASLAMGAAIEKLLGDRIKRGLLVTDRRHSIDVVSEVLVAGHPIPTSDSLRSGQRVVDLVKKCRETSLVIFLVSGGGSALVELPVGPNVLLEDIQNLNSILITCGATIREINVIRKHFSSIKGGKLGHLVGRSKIIGLYISDVNPGDLRSIASNPLLEEEASVEEFYALVERYRLKERLPESYRGLIEERKVEPLPRGWSQGGNRPTTLLLLDNSVALRAAAEEAKTRGFQVEIAEDVVEGAYKEVAQHLIERLLELQARHPNESVCLISGGEVSCPVTGDGIGGRNQEFVLYSASRLAGLNDGLDVSVLSCGTDGIDGNSNAAGAAIGVSTKSLARSMGLEISPYIHRNDSNSFLKQSGGLVFTGPTGNNVRDVRVMLSRKH